MQKENQRVMLTKRMLKESMLQLLHRRNIRDISIRELCDEAGINRSTFYKYYGSQYDLLAEMEYELLDHIQNNISADMSVDDKGVQQLALLLTYLESNLDLARLLINNNIDPEFPQKLIELPRIQELLKERMSGQFKEKDYEYVSTFMIQGAYHMVRLWINKEVREPSTELASLLLSLVTAME